MSGDGRDPDEPAPDPDHSAKLLGVKRHKALLQHFSDAFEHEWNGLAFGDRLVLLEVCCSPESELTRCCQEVFGAESGKRMHHENGGDVETRAGRDLVKQVIYDRRPRLVWISPECGPFSPLQHLNRRTEQQRADLQEKRRHAKLQYEGAVEIAEYAKGLGIDFVIELSERCEAWQLPVLQKFQDRVQGTIGVCKGCQVGLRDKDGQLLGKGWKMLGSNQELIRHMSLRCTTDHPHGKCEGSNVCRSTAFYPPRFAKRVMEHLKLAECSARVLRELVDGCDMTGAVGLHVDHEDSVGLHVNHGAHLAVEDACVVSPERRQEILSSLRRIHSATGHCSVDYLLRALKKRNASAEVIEVARDFQCPICEERVSPRPRPQSSLEDLPEKWCRMQADAGTWVHPDGQTSVQFLLGIDEGSRFRVGSLLPAARTKGISGSDLVDFYETRWKPLFGDPSAVRVDPAGAFRGHMIDEYFSSRNVLLDTIPAEAHWQLSLAERSVQTTKSMMTALALEFPEMRVQELFARVLWAQNAKDQYLGFSPMQHVFGRSPLEDTRLHQSPQTELPVLTEHGVSAEFGVDMLAMKRAEQLFIEEQYKHRMSRAEASGSRKVPLFRPGDLVFYWRKQLGGSNRPSGSQTFRSGAFLGPARVLATETRLNEDGTTRAGSCIWIVRGSRLFKVAPQQLRFASSREAAWCELEEDQPLPWTISGCLDAASRKTYVDLTPDAADMPVSPDDEPAILVPRTRKRYKQPDPRTAAIRPTKSSRTDIVYGEDEELLALVAVEPSPHLQSSPDACLALEIDLPERKTAKKGYWLRNLEAFVVNQAKKNHVEVCERRLTPSEKAQFETAKQKEVKNFILAKVFEQVPVEQRPSRDQVLKMRWVLTWKLGTDGDDSTRKAKARAVILGYQDPDYHLRATASPTMSRSTRQLFLSLCSARKFLVKKGDVSGAFLQGRPFKDDVYVEPLLEICKDLGIPEGSITRLAKAAYGLVQAPLEWYLTVDEFLRGIGFERCKTDPCCWGVYDTDNEPIGYVCGHVDDFLFGGHEKDDRWLALEKQIKEKFTWGEWESRKFTQCGVDIEQRADYSFTLKQPHYLDSTSEIYISKPRLQQPDAETTADEKSQMKSVLGSLSWHAGQVAMNISAGVGLLSSKIASSTVKDIVEVNKLLRCAKSHKDQSMIIHCLDPSDLLLAAWVDAAQANRADGSSTKGIFIGLTSPRLLDGSLEAVNPIFWCSSKIARVCRSSAAAETRAAVDGEDQLYALRFQLSELRGLPANVFNPDDTVQQTRGVLVSDSKNVYDRLTPTMLTLKGAEKRCDIESLCLKEAMQTTNLSIRWVNGEAQLGNSLTKPSEPQQLLHYMHRGGRWRIVYDQEMISGKRRKSLGLDRLEPKREDLS